MTWLTLLEDHSRCFQRLTGRGKGSHREPGWEARAVMQVRHVGGLDQGGSWGLTTL